MNSHRHVEAPCDHLKIAPRAHRLFATRRIVKVFVGNHTLRYASQEQGAPSPGDGGGGALHGATQAAQFVGARLRNGFQTGNVVQGVAASIAVRATVFPPC